MGYIVFVSVCMVLVPVIMGSSGIFPFLSSSSLSEDNPIREELQKNPGTQLGKGLSREEMEELREKLRRGELTVYTPEPVRNPECYVEYQVTHRAPGRCTRLGGRIPACQSVEMLQIDERQCS